MLAIGFALMLGGGSEAPGRIQRRDFWDTAHWSGSMVHFYWTIVAYRSHHDEKKGRLIVDYDANSSLNLRSNSGPYGILTGKLFGPPGNR